MTGANAGEHGPYFYWLMEGLLTANQLRPRLSEEHGVQVTLWLVQSALKAKGSATLTSYRRR